MNVVKMVADAVEQAKQEQNKVKKDMIYNNITVDIYENIVDDLCLILNCYIGQKLGEKRLEEIKEDFARLTGCRLYPERSYQGRHLQNFKVYPLDANGYSYITKIFEFSVSLNTEKYEPIAPDHTINQVISPDMLKCSHTRIEDIDAEYERLLQAYIEVKQAYENYSKACDKYNQLNRVHKIKNSIWADWKRFEDFN